MTRPDLDALSALLDKATPGPWDDCGAWVTPSHRKFTESRDENAALIVAAVNALPALIARVRELERERDQAALNRACADALVSAAQDMTRAAALAMRERCAQECEEIARSPAQIDDRTDYVADDCAAAVRALEP